MKTKEQISILQANLEALHDMEHESSEAMVMAMRNLVQKIFGRQDESLLIALSAITGTLLNDSFGDMQRYCSGKCGHDLATIGMIDPGEMSIYQAAAIKDIEDGLV